MTRFAENTSVSPEKSKAEIERILQRYGADQFMYGVDHGRGLAFIRFNMNEKQVKFVLSLPRPDAPEFTQSPTGRRKRDSEAAYNAWEQAIRQRWRALALVIKAKLEAVETGITCFEDEFLAHILLPSGECGRVDLPADRTSVPFQQDAEAASGAELIHESLLPRKGVDLGHGRSSKRSNNSFLTQVIRKTASKGIRRNIDQDCQAVFS